MANQSILIGSGKSGPSVDRAAELAKVNDDLAVSLLNQPCAAFTCAEVMWLIRFHEKWRIADNEEREKSFNETLKELAERALTYAETRKE